MKGFIKCVVCGRITERTGARQRYCPKCAKRAQSRDKYQYNELRRELRQAQKGMAAVDTGKLDENLRKAREQGLTYAELQKQETLRKIRAGEL